MVRREEPRVYPGAENLDVGGSLSVPLTQTLGTRKLEAPVEDRSTDGPVAPDRNDADPFLDIAIPALPPGFALDTFEGYLVGEVIDGLNLTDAISTLTFGGPWRARSNWVSIMGLEDWESYAVWAEAEGLGNPAQGFGGVWHARTGTLGVRCLEDWELYPAGDTADDKGFPRQGFGGKWKARTSYYGIQVLDDFESYSNGEALDQKQNADWPLLIFARSTSAGSIVAAEDFQEDASYGEFDDVTGKNAGTGWATAWNGYPIKEPILYPRYMDVTGEFDMRAQLSSESELSRTLAIGTAWNKIRIAVRWSVQGGVDIGDNFQPPPNFAIGVCSGLTNRFLATTDNFVGVNIHTGFRWPFYPANTWFLGSPPQWIPGSVAACVKVGSTITYGVGASVITKVLQGATGPLDPGLPHRKMILIDIEKGSPYFRVSCPLKDLGSVDDLTQAQFLEQAEIEYPTSPIYGHTGPGVITPNSVAVDEAGNGYLDSVTVAFWGYGAQGKFELSDVVVTQFS